MPRPLAGHLASHDRSSMASTPFDGRRFTGRGTSRLYLFGLVAICTFLLAVIASGSLLSVHQAETAIVLQSGSTDVPEPSAEALQAQLLARDNLLAALGKLGLEASATQRVKVAARTSE